MSALWRRHARRTQRRRSGYVRGRGGRATVPISSHQAFCSNIPSFKKGLCEGRSASSPLHTLSIINVGDARTEDIVRLARDMQDAVERVFGVRLEREVEYIGAVESV